MALWQNSENLGVILAHHGVLPSQEGLSPLEQKRHVSQDFLRRQLAWLQDHEFQFVALSKMVEDLQNNNLQGRRAAVTFDDGLFNVAEFATPVLREFNARACVFLVGRSVEYSQWQWTDIVEQHWRRQHSTVNWQKLSDFKKSLRACSVEARDATMRKMKKENTGIARVLTAQDINAMDREIFEFGCHSMTHASLSQIKGSTSELVLARATLEHLIHQPVRLYAYPFGEYDNDIKPEIRAAGFRAALTVQPRPVQNGDDLFELGRLEPVHWESFTCKQA